MEGVTWLETSIRVEQVQKNIKNSYKAFSFIPDPKTNFGI